MTERIPGRVLVIEDDPDYRNLLQRFLGKAFPDADVNLYDPVADGRPDAGFDWSSYDVLLLDYRLGDSENGLDWLRQFKENGSSFPATILLTAAGSEEVAVGALRFGAHDYLKKQHINSKRLAESINDAFNVRAKEASISQSLTINASRFSKSYFYGQFDLAFDEAEKGEQRGLILIKIDGYDSLHESLGVLATDELARFLANAGTEVFKFGKYSPRATRFTDASIAFIVGGYEGKAGLEALVVRLIDRIAKTSPLINGTPVPITVSVGAVPIESREPGVAGLLEQADKAAREAAAREGNTDVVARPKAASKPTSRAVERPDSFDAKSAMRENRIQAMFRPITDLSGRGAVLGFDEFFEICPRFIQLTGESLPSGPILTEAADATLSRIVDRWKIRECVSRLLSGKIPGDQVPGFLISLCEASCSDVNLSHWIGELVRYYGSKKKFGEIVASVEPDVLMRNTKPVVALMEHLKSRHGFKFALDGVEDPGLCKVCLSNYPFEIVALSDVLAQELFRSGAQSQSFERLVAVKGDALILARGVENADGLHGLIAAGVDLVQGDFIAPEQEEVEAAVGIEAVSLDDTPGWRPQ